MRYKKITPREWREMVSPAAGQKTKSGAQAKAKNGPMPERYPNGGGMDQQNPSEPRTDAGVGRN